MAPATPISTGTGTIRSSSFQGVEGTSQGISDGTEEGISDQESASNLDPVTERLMAIMREKEGMRR